MLHKLKPYLLMVGSKVQGAEVEVGQVLGEVAGEGMVLTTKVINLTLKQKC